MNLSRLFSKPIRRAAPMSSVTLSRRVIYVLPTRHGLVFGLLLAVMLGGAMNYNNSMGFVLTFLLGSLSLISILHTYYNLAGLRFEPGKAESVFAGEALEFVIRIDNRGQRTRYALDFLRQAGGEKASAEVPENAYAAVTLAVATQRRGIVPLGRVTVETQFPLTLFVAWSYLDLQLDGLVYPTPHGSRVLPPGQSAADGQDALQGGGADDFTGHRNYASGDSPRHVDWKVVARGQGWLTKQFSGGGQSLLWLNWDDTGQTQVEAALGQLCLWVLEADRQEIRYGLRLPAQEIAPGQGDEHRRRCLEALAWFGEDKPQK
jgi:uncharacterized protein (DUF58 family)